MARKSTRPAKTTDRYGTTRGNDEAVAANSTAATAGCLPKSTAAKRKGKKMKPTYSSSSEASDTSMSSASSDNSLGHVPQTRSDGGSSSNQKRKKSHTRRLKYKSRCPTWDGDKSNWTEYAEQLRLFLREINKTWDI